MSGSSGGDLPGWPQKVARALTPAASRQLQACRMTAADRKPPTLWCRRPQEVYALRPRLSMLRAASSVHSLPVN